MTSKVICLDIEGGHGGSSRSLQHSLQYIDRERFEPIVICRRDGPFREDYRKNGVETVLEPSMPKVSSLPQFSRNLVIHALAVRDWFASKAFRARLLSRVENTDLVHLNHEALWWLAAWLRRRTKKPITMHMRTCPWPSVFATIQARSILQKTDDRVFITEMEKKTWEGLADQPMSGRVVHNIVDCRDHTPLASLSNDNRYLIACLSSFSYLRGLDRIVLLAAALKRRGMEREIGFVICGDMKLSSSEAKRIGMHPVKGATLADFAVQHGVENLFQFLGHVSNPENVLSACNALIKPTRENNPWGRDILEALAVGRPVFTVGTYDKFVEDGKTGILQPDFDADAMAEKIVALSRDRETSSALGAAGRERVQQLCDGQSRAADLSNFWEHAIRAAQNDDRRLHPGYT